jgi:hypothetical protein
MCRISIRYGCYSIFKLSHCFRQFITSLYAASLFCFLISTQNNKGNGYKYINWIKPTGVSEKWLVNRGVRPSGSSSSVGFCLFTDVSGQPTGAHPKGSSNPKTLVTYRRTLGTNPVKKDLKYRAAVAWKLVRLCFAKLYMFTVSGMSSVSYRCRLQSVKPGNNKPPEWTKHSTFLQGYQHNKNSVQFKQFLLTMKNRVT